MAQYTLKKVLNFIRLKDIGHLFLVCLIFPFAIVAKIFIRGVWLVCEEKNEARDNGYWFYKWVRENRSQQRIIYAINKKSVDYSKVKDLGKVISYGSIAHWFWYIVADKNISSQKGGKPNAAVCYFFEVVLGFRKNNRVFLQHGVTINKGNWLFYKNTYFRLFITATREETEYVLDNFGYPSDRVKLLGFSRYDNLNDFIVDKQLILVMPTWRNWLGREAKDNKNINFCDTEYFKRWNGLLNNKKFIEILDKYDRKVLFYPHRNMQKFISDFSVASDRIKIADWHNYDIQQVLRSASVMVTDYSSVFFDFAYMCKPVIFYQFDEAEYREKQYQQGFFDYKNNRFSLWTGDEDDLLETIEEVIKGKYITIDDKYVNREFAHTCELYSEKIYNEIKAL